MNESNAPVRVPSPRSSAVDEEVAASVIATLYERDQLVYAAYRSLAEPGQIFYTTPTEVGRLCNLTPQRARAAMQRLRFHRVVEFVEAETRGNAHAQRLVRLTADHDVVQMARLGRRRAGGRRAPQQGRTGLYRWFDGAGLLLYIGITNDMSTRQTDHARTSSWSQFACSATIQWFPTRDEAALAEARAVTTEKPLFNRTYSNIEERRQTLAAYLERQGRTDLLTVVNV